MKAPLQIIRAILLFFVLILVFPSAYGAAMCGSSSSTNATDTLTDSGGSSGNYSKNESCTFLIQPTGANSVTLSFSAFNLKKNSGFLTIYDGSTTASPVLANNLTGNKLPASVTSSGGTMLVRFSSNSSVTRSGFIAGWTSTIGAFGAAMCGSSSSTDESGTLTDSGGSGSNYDNGENCYFLIQPEDASTITLTFSAFSLESGYDFLTIYDGSTTASPVLANNLSGNSLPASVTSSGSAMLVRFSSDFSITSSGFIASWTSTGDICLAKNVGDNFPNVSYSQNSGSENWSESWTEVGESDGVSAGIARVQSGLCTSDNCLRLGVPSGNSAQNYSDKGVYREIDLSGSTSATLSFVYRNGVNQGSQTIVLSVYDGSNWTNLQSYFISSTNTSPTS
ncbi:MAG: CUB domain-containing protein, partial [Colwellia sp.]|nr:CUB domain-containing protein [Colwellia sp.]